MARTNGDYEWDVFISYKRAAENQGDSTEEWVRNHLYPQLQRWLPQHLKKGSAKIFLDVKGIKKGTHWPSELRDALQRSRCMVAVFSTTYFTSKWCNAELDSMLKRARVLGKRNKNRLLYGLTYADGEHFPSNIQELSVHDLNQWNYPDKIYTGSPSYLTFIDKIKEISADLAKVIAAAPPWRAWPTSIPRHIPRAAQLKALPRPRS